MKQQDPAPFFILSFFTIFATSCFTFSSGIIYTSFHHCESHHQHLIFWKIVRQNTHHLLITPIKFLGGSDSTQTILRIKPPHRSHQHQHATLLLHPLIPLPCAHLLHALSERCDHSHIHRQALFPRGSQLRHHITKHLEQRHHSHVLLRPRIVLHCLLDRCCRGPHQLLHEVAFLLCR